MIANITDSTALDFLVRDRKLYEMYSNSEDEQCLICRTSGIVRQEYVDLLASRAPLPALYFLEDRDGNIEPIGDYANDLMTTAFRFIRENEGPLPTVRRIRDTVVRLHIIRCTNSKDNVDAFLKILRDVNVIC